MSVRGPSTSGSRPASPGRLACVLVVVAAASGPVRADSVDRVQMGVGMGAMGASIGAAAGSTGALVGGLVGVGIGAALADDPRYHQRVDPAEQRAREAERAAWLAERRSSEERLRNDQRVAFESRLHASGSSQGRVPPPSDALVEQIQRALARAGYEPGALDGTVSPATVSAIESFQQDHRLTVTGEPSVELLQEIRRAGG